MPGPLQVIAAGVVDSGGAPAVAKVSANTRVKTAQGFVTLQTDTMLFAGAPPMLSLTGQWLVANQRVLIGGTPSVGASSTGLTAGGTPTTPTSGPMTVLSGDPRVQGQ
jgi:hypothetical protein